MFIFCRIFLTIILLVRTAGSVLILRSMKKQLLIFDLDGTLADTRHDLATAVNQMRIHYGLVPLSVSRIVGYIGGGLRALVCDALQGAPVELDEAVALAKQFYEQHMLDRSQLYPGVAPGLAALADHHALAVLTNKPGDASRAMLEHFGIASRFFQVVGGGDVPSLKPAPDGVDALRSASGFSPDETWMIGDHHTDLAVAQRAGVHSGFVGYGIGNAGPFTADQTWNSFYEIVYFFTTK